MSAAAAGQEATPAIAAEVEWEACACCGLREECTPAYAAGVRARYGGRWLCGLCGDAVGEEVVAAGDGSALEVAAAAPQREWQAGEGRLRSSSGGIPGALMNPPDEADQRSALAVAGGC